MSSKLKLSSLQKQVSQQVQLLTKLQTLLESELHLISGRDANALQDVVNEKQGLLEEIQALDDVISSLYQAASPEQQEDSQLQQLLSEAKIQLEQCKFRTEVNQQAVEQGQLRLDHLRQLIMEVRAKENFTYDKEGRPQSRSSGKTISA
jgi:flagella synthesis protein FlgN